MDARWLVIGLLGCSGEPTPPTVITIDTPVPPETPVVEPDLRVDEQADVHVRLSGATRDEGERLGIAAWFGEGLEGGRYPASCALTQGLCLSDDVGFETSTPMGTPVSVERSSWLGDEILVERYPLGFIVDPEIPLGGYVYEEAFEGSLPQWLGLEVERGEWGPQSLLALVPGPDPHGELSPDPTQPVDLAGDPLLPLSWRAIGDGTLWVTLEKDGQRWARRVPDTGEALVDFRDWRLDTPVELGLHRVRTSVRSHAGHQLTVHAETEQSWCVVDRCEDPPLPSWPAWMGFEYCWSPDNCATSRWTFAADGTWATADGFGGTWSYDCCRRELTIQFGSGTTYWGTFDDGGCLTGHMQSWSGNTGTWSGCF